MLPQLNWRAFEHTSCELHTFTAIGQQSKWLSGHVFDYHIQQESLGCPVVVSQDCAVCLAAQYTERQGSPRLQELADTNVEGAVLFPELVCFMFFTQRPQHSSRFQSWTSLTPCSLSSWLSGILHAPTFKHDKLRSNNRTDGKPMTYKTDIAATKDAQTSVSF